MTWTALVLAYGMQTGLLYLASTSITKKDDKFKSLKLYLFLYAVFNTFLMGVIPFVITANPADVAAFNIVAISLASINVIVLIGFVLLYGAGMLQTTFDLILSFTKGK